MKPTKEELEAKAKELKLYTHWQGGPGDGIYHRTWDDVRADIVSFALDAVREAREDAVERERESIVRWLRDRAAWLRREFLNGGTCQVEMEQSAWIADAIARGRHAFRPEEPDAE